METLNNRELAERLNGQIDMLEALKMMLDQGAMPFVSKARMRGWIVTQGLLIQAIADARRERIVGEFKRK